ncbi:peptidase S8 [Paenibacillus sp. IB182496]|uniref:Peptidase S8 n=1 Tax=Paenibacillus sabuli TaxID=2772509 RepID=A0A927BS35_9BACL|nr:S8 family peptidase [Paenibacillus sabuli]MBD2844433.1 peptidase S8 [Paenibacillus sabuli]
MRRMKWMLWAAPLALAALLLLMRPAAAPPTQEAEPPPAGSDTAREESRWKSAAVQTDMALTAKLCAASCDKALQQALADMRQGDQDAVRRMMKRHPHMRFVASHSGETGTLAPELQSLWRTHYKQAQLAMQQGKPYRSELMELNGRHYMIVGAREAPDSGSKDGHDDGLVALVRPDIVTEVERHQRRNLRLVPYPEEGRYRTESITPGTMHDMTVDNGEANGNASHYYDNEVVVRFREDPEPSELKRIQREIGAHSVRKLGYTFVFRSHAMDTKALVDYFDRKWQPHYVEPHYLYMTNDSAGGGDSAADAGAGASVVPNDTLYSDYQWNLPKIETEQGWAVGKGSDDVVVAVLDTGVQIDHPDLQDRLVAGINIVDKSAPPDDDVGHGTHVTGIIAATVNNHEGVAGLSWYNRVMPVKVLDGSGAGTTYSVAEGIIWATDHGAKIINMSLGNYASAQFLHDAIRYAYDHDVVLIAASGNDNTERPGYPAAYPEVFAVAATDPHDNRASFSNYGDYIDVAAPGLSIASTYPGDQYAALSGTSMASPHVAALAALIRSHNPELDNEAVMELMRASAIDLGAPGRDSYFGFGQIDVAGALGFSAQGALATSGADRVGPLERLLAQLRRLIGG